MTYINWKKCSNTQIDQRIFSRQFFKIGKKSKLQSMHNEFQEYKILCPGDPHRIYPELSFLLFISSEVLGSFICKKKSSASS